MKKILNLLFLLLIIIPFKANATFTAEGLNSFIPRLNDDGILSKFDISIKMIDTSSNSRSIRILFAPKGTNLLNYYPNIKSTTIPDNYYLSTDVGSGYQIPSASSTIDISTFGGIDTNDVTFAGLNSSSVKNLDVSVDAVELDKDTSYDAHLVMRLTQDNPPTRVYRVISSLGVLDPLTIIWYKQNTEGDYNSKEIYTHFIKGNNISIDTFPAPAGYVLNTQLTTGLGIFNGQEIHLYYDRIPSDNLDNTTKNVNDVDSLLYMVDRNVNDFVNVKLNDNNLVKDEDYIVFGDDESTLVQFTPIGLTKLQNLGEGSYKIELIFNDETKEGNITLKPLYFVSYKTLEHGEDFTLSVFEGELAENRKVKDSKYIVDAWYTEEELENKFDFNEPIMENKTIYAKWIINPQTGDDIIVSIVTAISIVIYLTTIRIYYKKKDISLY